MNKIRLLSVAIIACAAGAYLFSQRSGIDPLVRRCNASETPQTMQEHCNQAYAAAHLTDAERGIVTFRLGHMHDLDGDWETAIRYYSETIDLYPAKASAFYNRGLLRRKHQDDFVGAIADFSAYLSARQDDTGGLIQRGRTYRKIDELDLAQADIEQALTRAPGHQGALREQVELLLDQDNNSAALRVLDQAITLHPDTVYFWRQRSWVKRLTDDYAGALADINHVIATAPNPSWPWYQRGWLNIQLENYAQGLTDLQEAIAKDPSYRPATRQLHALMSNITAHLRDEPEKLTAFANAGLVNDPENTELIYLRALGQLGEGKFIGAVNDINNVIAAAEHPQPYIFARAAIYVSQGQLDLAMADLRYLTQDPLFTTPAIEQLSNRAKALEEAGQNDEIDAIVSKIGDLAGLYSKALRTRLNLHRQLQDWSGALETVDLMVAYDGDDSRHWTTRGKILEQLGRQGDALESYSAAIRLVETNARDFFNDEDARANALLHRGALYQSQSRALDAQNDFDAALSGENQDLIRAFQQKMQAAGHYTGPLNGVYDSATQSAVKSCSADTAC